MSESVMCIENEQVRADAIRQLYLNGKTFEELVMITAYGRLRLRGILTGQREMNRDVELTRLCQLRYLAATRVDVACVVYALGEMDAEPRCVIEGLADKFAEKLPQVGSQTALTLIHQMGRVLNVNF